MPNSGSNLPDIAPYKASVLSPDALNLPEDADPNKKIDEEIEKLRLDGIDIEKESNASIIGGTPAKEATKAPI